MVNKIISYSLWGNDPRYTENIFRNFPAKDKYYPDWNVRVYYQNITDETYNKLELHDCQLIPTINFPLHPMFTRFLPADDTNIDAVIFRDADSILNYREKKAVDEWLQTGKVLHSMRDAGPHNMLFQSGMWGIRPKLKTVNIEDVYQSMMGNSILQNTYKHVSGYTWRDQTFLEALSTTYYKKEDILAHDNDLRHDDVQCVKLFPTGERPRQHVGYAFVDHTEEIEKDPAE